MMVSSGYGLAKALSFTEIWVFPVANYSTIVFGLILYAGPFYTIWKLRLSKCWNSEQI